MMACQSNPSNVTFGADRVVNCKIFANVDGLRLRSTPGENGEEVTKVRLGTELKDLNQCSDFETKIKLQGVWYTEPWIMVETLEGQRGWVYAGAVSFKGDTPAASSMALIEKRATTLFGAAIFQEILAYRKSYFNANTDLAIRAVLLRGDQLRKKLEQTLVSKITVSEETNSIPAMDWLDVLLPGYQASLVTEGTEYRLFKTFKIWSQKAKLTTGDADNQYFDYCQSYYADSIEYFFGKNYMLLTDVEGASLLGEGRHLELLRKAAAVLQQSQVFRTEMLQYKTDLLDDIMGVKGVTYWQPKDKIIKEISDIEDAGIAILDQADRIALSTRKKQFDNPSANGILVNQRAGG